MSFPVISHAFTPVEHAQQGITRLSLLAWRTDIEMDGIKQAAWLLATVGVRDQDEADFAPRWLRAVERHAGELVKKRIITPQTARKIVKTFGKSERRSQRYKKRLEQCTKVLGDLFAGTTV